MIRSLRARLLLGTAASTAAILAVAGLALHAMMHRSLYAAFDRSLDDKARTLANMIEQEGEHVELDFLEAEPEEFRRSERPEYFQLWDCDEAGATVTRSDSLHGSDLLPAAPTDSAAAVVPHTLPDGRPGRIVTMRFEPRFDPKERTPSHRKTLALALARDTLNVEATLATLRSTMLGVGLIATAAALVVLALFVHLGLRPAKQLAHEIHGIDERRLSARLSADQAPAELRPIVARLNELLAKLEDAFAREKTMTANVAHELRTPLAGLRSMFEVALTRERDSAAYRQTIHDSLAVCREMHALVENLLVLARLDAGGNGSVDAADVRADGAALGADRTVRPKPLAATDVKALLESAWSPHAEAAREKQLDVRWDVGVMEPAAVDADQLRLVLGNLLSNAVTYADNGGAVEIAAETSGRDRRFSVRVSNTGSAIAAEDVPRVFDRFWRGDPARSGDGLHCGLGLSLCKLVAERMGGEIAVESEAGGCFVVTLTV